MSSKTPPKPYVMVAPNGARRGTSEHPNLPVTIQAIVKTAEECFAVGANAIHAHVRDACAQHSLDGGLYRELLSALADTVPKMAVQITTESAGKYSANAQRKLLYELQPTWASVSLKEMLSDNDFTSAKRLYYWAHESNMRLQHILYTPQEVQWLVQCIEDNIIPPSNIEVLLVLGEYIGGINGTPSMLPTYLQPYKKLPEMAKFMVCAFGRQETDCLLAAVANGGDCRIGFENNLYHSNGQLANNNAERVCELVDAIQS